MKAESRPYRWLRWILALAALAFVAHALASEPEPILRILATGPEVLLGLCVLVVFNQVLIALRFKLAMEHSGAHGIGLSVWFRLTSVGQMLNLFVPQLGNLYRGVTLKREHGISYLMYAGGLVSFIWLDVMMGLAIAFGVILVVDPGLHFADVSALLVLGVGGGLICLGPIVGSVVLRRLPMPTGAWGKLQQRLADLLYTTSGAVRSPALMARFFLLNVFVTAGQTATLWLAFHSVGAEPGLSGLVLFQVVLKLSSQVVVTPGNLGITELLFGALAHGSEQTLQQGLAVSLLLRAVGSAVVVVLGLLTGGVAALTSGRRDLLEQGRKLTTDPAQSFSATKK